MLYFIMQLWNSFHHPITNLLVANRPFVSKEIWMVPLLNKRFASQPKVFSRNMALITLTSLSVYKICYYLYGSLHCFSPKLYCDNTRATYLCANPLYHLHMKHVILDYHFILEMVSNGSLQVLHFISTNQSVDTFTKPLGRDPSLKLHSQNYSN